MPSPLVDKPTAAIKSTVSVAQTPQQPAATPMQRAKTLIYNPPAPVGAPAPAPAPAAAPVAQAPVAARPITAVSPAMPRPTPALTATLPGAGTATEEVKAPAHATLGGNAPSPVGAQLNGKLEQLGLTPAQVEAVTALSRDIIERVVWEIVPVLAETLIKEELSRLTK
jgi:hypothetical protein